MQSKNIKYSLLELAILSEGASMKQTLDNTITLAQKAEELGYNRIWFAEHHNAQYIASSAPALLIGHTASQTKKIRVGSGGIMLPNHAALVVAEQFGTLAQMYPGRIDLGLGRAPGTDQQTAHAIRPDFIQAAQNFPEEVKKIQTYFSDTNAKAAVRAPIAEGTNVPVYILGSSTDSAHLAAEFGLPYAFASHFATAQLLPALQIYRSRFQPSAVLDQPYTMAGVNIIVADTDEEAQQLFTTILKMFVGILTGARQALQPPAAMTPDLEQLLEHPSVHQMLKYSFVGSKQTVKKQVEEFIKQTGVNEIIAATANYSLADRLKSITLFSEIMAEINARNQVAELV